MFSRKVFCSAAQASEGIKAALSGRPNLGAGLALGAGLVGLNAWVVHHAMGGLDAKVDAVGVKIEARVWHSWSFIISWDLYGIIHVQYCRNPDRVLPCGALLLSSTTDDKKKTTSLCPAKGSSLNHHDFNLVHGHQALYSHCSSPCREVYTRRWRQRRRGWTYSS